MEKDVNKSDQKKSVEKNTTTEKPKKELSNKAQIYRAWETGETDQEKLLQVVKGAVKLQMVKGWINRWKNKKAIPKGV